MISRREMYSIVEALFQNSIEILEDQVMDIAERTVIEALEPCDVNHNKAFVKRALLSALSSLLTSILKDEYGIKESFESAIVQVATCEVVLSIILKAMVFDHAVLTPIVQFVVEAVKSEAAMSVTESAVMATPLPPPSGSSSSTDKEKKECEKKGSRCKYQRQSASSASSGENTWSLSGSPAKSVVVAKREESHVGDTTPKLEVLHPTDRNFQRVFNCNNYRLLGSPQIFDR